MSSARDNIHNSSHYSLLTTHTPYIYNVHSTRISYTCPNAHIRATQDTRLETQVDTQRKPEKLCRQTEWPLTSCIPCFPFSYFHFLFLFFYSFPFDSMCTKEQLLFYLNNLWLPFRLFHSYFVLFGITYVVTCFIVFSPEVVYSRYMLILSLSLDLRFLFSIYISTIVFYSLYIVHISNIHRLLYLISVVLPLGMS